MKIMSNGPVPSEPMAYGLLISRNVIAARSRLRMSQSSLAARMKALGHGWYSQTAGMVERAERRIVAEEILSLALALETSVSALMAPAADDELVALPSGQAIPAESVRNLLRYVNTWQVTWQDDSPVFSDGPLPEIGDLIRQLMTPMAISSPPETQAKLEAISAAATAGSPAGILKLLSPEFREALAAALTGQDGGS